MGRAFAGRKEWHGLTASWTREGKALTPCKRSGAQLPEASELHGDGAGAQPASQLVQGFTCEVSFGESCGSVAEADWELLLSRSAKASLCSVCWGFCSDDLKERLGSLLTAQVGPALRPARASQHFSEPRLLPGPRFSQVAKRLLGPGEARSRDQQSRSLL